MLNNGSENIHAQYTIRSLNNHAILRLYFIILPLFGLSLLQTRLQALLKSK